MTKLRLDQAMVTRGVIKTRSQAENYIKLGRVEVNGKILNKSSILVNEADEIKVTQAVQYVSRAALKLESVAENLNLGFKDKIVLDVGSSTGGFTDFALKAGAKKVIAVDVGTDQMHEGLRDDPRIELHEKTDIRDFKTRGKKPDLLLIDVSFISLREILPHVATLADKNSDIVAMVKPQFEAGIHQVTKGVIKNDSVRRQTFKDFENWAKQNGFWILRKADSKVTGAKGNRERFYRLRKS